MTNDSVSESPKSDNLKQCTRCGELKPATLEFFYAHKSTRCGLGSWCRSCHVVVGKKRAQPSRIAAREAESNWKRENPGMKKCTQCGEGKPATLEYFRADKRIKCGLAARCRACENIANKCYQEANREKVLERGRASQRKYRAENADKVRESGREYYRRNREKKREANRRYLRENAEKRREYTRAYQQANADRIRKAQREYRLANADSIRERNRRYCEANPQLRRASQHRRRARERQSEGTHTAADIRAQFASQKSCCWWCGKKIKDGKYHVDHRIPLARGGSNAPENIVIACPGCNMSKHDRLPHEWCGRLL